MTEAELFLPIKKYFEELNYVIDGEVVNCDMLMVRDDDYIAIELKKDLNLKLLTQGAKRQKLFQQVYVAIWSPKNLRSKAFRDKVYILNRLGIGLIIVTKRAKKVSIIEKPVVHPLESYQRRNKRLRERTKAELEKRRSKSNTGGVNRNKIMTAYKEECLIVLDLLNREGSMKASIIKEKTGVDKSYNIVYNNHYGWFVKEDKGIYGITQAGELAHKENKEIITVITGGSECKQD